MKFSILIANYNNATYLEECYQSILQQEYKDVEIVIVDDASTDTSVLLINQLIASDKRIVFHQNKENKGCGFTKNKCTELATGDVAGFLDPDDTLEKESVRLMIEQHKRNPDASLIYSTHFICNQNLSNRTVNLRTGRIQQNYLLEKKYNVSHFATFKMGKYRLTSGINPNLKRAVDQDLYYKLEEVGESIFVNKPLYNYRVHDGGISTGKKVRKAKYWHLLVQEDAYRRRLDTSLEIHYNVIKQRWKNYYFSLLDEGKENMDRSKMRLAYCKLFSLEKTSNMKDKLSFLKKSFFPV